MDNLHYSHRCPVIHSIMTPIIGGLFGGIAIVIIMWSFYYNYLMTEYLFERIRENTFLKLKNMCYNFMEKALASQVKRQHSDLLTDFKNNADIRVINVFNGKGEIVHSTREENKGKFRVQYLKKFPQGGEEFSKRSVEHDEYVYHCVLVLKNAASCRQCHSSDKAVVGGIESDISLEPAIKNVKKFQHLVYLLGALLICVVLLTCIVIFYFYLKKPIHNIIVIMENVAKGNLHIRANTDCQYELRDLAEGFNQMIESLEQNREKLHDAHLFELRQRERNASLGNLALNLSHNMKNPLACIDAALHSLSGELKLDESQAEIMKEIREQVKRLDYTIHDFLTLARPITFDCHFMDMLEILEKTVLLIEHKATSSQISLKKDFSPVLSEIQFEYNQIQKVLLNILLNAIEAMPRGGVLQLIGNAVNSHVVIEIADTGPGMSSDHLAKIFQPFFTTKATGTGLGLSISKQIVEALQGTIQLESKIGKGTRVIITLPKKTS